MFTERFTSLTYGGKTVYLTADTSGILQIRPTPPLAMGILRHDGHPILSEAREQLSDYFSGRRQVFSFPVTASFVPFANEVYNAVAQIPYGQCLSCSELAATIGKPSSVRAVETYCRCNPLYIYIPTHRVIPAYQPMNMFDRALLEMERRFAES